MPHHLQNATDAKERDNSSATGQALAVAEHYAKIAYSVSVSGLDHYEPPYQYRALSMRDAADSFRERDYSHDFAGARYVRVEIESADGAELSWWQVDTDLVTQLDYADWANLG